MCHSSAVRNCQQFEQLRPSVWKTCQPFKQLELYVQKRCYPFQSLGLYVSVWKKKIIHSNGWSYLFQFALSICFLRPCPHESGQFLNHIFFYLRSCGWGLKLLWRAVSKQCNFDDPNLQKPTLRGQVPLVILHTHFWEMWRILAILRVGKCSML